LIDEDVLGFIRSSIPSVWALEILIMLRRERGRAWTCADIARELRANERLVSDVLQVFETSGLVSREEHGYRYAPASSVMDQLSDRLEAAHRERPVAVVRAIMSSPKEQLQIFADAFRFKDTPK
jgi:DNA-binding IclR family transcriptional regulator